MGMKLYIEHKQVSQSSSNRTSRVTVSVKCKWTTKLWNHKSPSGSLKIDGKSYGFKKSFNPNKTSSGTMTLFSKTVDVKHKRDGKKSLTCSAYFRTGTKAGTIKASYSKTLSIISATSPPKPSTTNSKKAKITKLDIQTGSTNALFAAWEWSKDKTKEYSVEWWYATGDGIWFEGVRTTTNIKNHTYFMPDNARTVRFKVKPISEKHKVKKKEVSYWTAEWAEKDHYAKNNPPLTPQSAPTVTIENKVLTAELQNLKVNADKIQFQIIKDDKTQYKLSFANIVTSSARYSCPIDVGSRYKVRARSNRGKEYSDWTDYSSNVLTEPIVPAGFTKCQASSATSVQLGWSAVNNADTYDIEFTDNIKHFDAGEGTSVISSITTTKYEKINLANGKEYFFRLRAVNSAGTSKWSKSSSVIIGKKPEPPTTWSYSESAIVGENMTLYWVHNAEDGSDQTRAEIEIVVGSNKEIKPIETPPTPDEDDTAKVHSDILDTSKYPEGAHILWRVRTAGVTSEYSDWSVQRTIDIYSRPSLELRVTDNNNVDLSTITSFPFHIVGVAGSSTQSPIGYHISIVANSTYEAVDDMGNIKLVNEGDEIYSKYYDIKTSLELEITANDIDLESGISYTLIGTASMNSGLTAESTVEFTVSWDDKVYTPDAEILIDQDNLTATIRPYCELDNIIYYKVTHDTLTNTYTETAEVIPEMDGQAIGDISITRYKVNYDSLTQTYLETNAVITVPDGVLVPDTLTDKDNAVYKGFDGVNDIYYYEVQTESGYTNNGNMVYTGTDSTGTQTYFYIHNDGTSIPVEGVTLSVYRKEFDGNFIEIATEIKNNATWVTDPHPSLNYAKYRIVAVDDATGSVGFYDVPPVFVGEESIVVQWKEEWGDLTVSSINADDPAIEPEWSGFMLKLPYNIGISNSHSPDVALVEYVGRKHPVPYYGTQLGETSSWSAEFDKDDEETLYLIRQLAIWMGDVYVREPSGSGYWAHIKVSYSQRYNGLTIPVSFSITRVEGGM